MMKRTRFTSVISQAHKVSSPQLYFLIWFIETKNAEKLPGRNLLLSEGNVLARSNYEQSEQDTPQLDMGAG